MKLSRAKVLASKPSPRHIEVGRDWNIVQQYSPVANLAPHDLRRTFAKLADRAGSPLAQIQKSLGHASVQTTERYVGSDLDLMHPLMLSSSTYHKFLWLAPILAASQQNNTNRHVSSTPKASSCSFIQVVAVASSVSMARSTPVLAISKSCFDCSRFW